MSNFDNQYGQTGVAFYDPVTDSIHYNNPPPPPYSASVPVPTVTAVTPAPLGHRTVIVQPPVRHHPTAYSCPSCQKRIITKVYYSNTKKTHVSAGFIFGVTVWCCLCCFAAVPYLIPSFKKADHFCPECNAYIGTCAA